MIKQLLKVTHLLLMSFFLLAAGNGAVWSQSVFINEIHYDNDGTDSGEAIEIAGPASTDLSGWSLVLYNGSGGAVYSTRPLGGIISDQQNGFGTISFPINGIQNGDPDGVALVNGNTVVQFLSYEGTFTAVGGPANGLTSTDISVRETSTTPAGTSLQLTGVGNSYEDFTWAGPVANTFGAVNARQTFESNNTSTLSISSVTEEEGNNGATNFTFTLMRSGPTAGSVTFDIATADGTAMAGSDYTANSLTRQTIPAGVSSYEFTVIVNGDVASEPDEAFTVNVTNVRGAVPGSVSATGTIKNDDAAPVTKIHEIQGSSSASPLVNQTRTIEGIVVGDFQENGNGMINGFFVQEEDADADSNPASSEGIFVFEGGSTIAVSIGDKVQVTGKVVEFFELTQLAELTNVKVIATGNALPAPATVELPFPSADFRERFEGMYVSLPQSLTVTNNFLLGRAGEFEVTSGERLQQPTQVVEPGAPAIALQQQNNLDRLIIDDGRLTQNPDPVPYPAPELNAENPLRTGDQVNGLIGVLTYSWSGFNVSGVSTNAYRLHPTAQPSFVESNPRTAAPKPVAGDLKVASFNVLNYFTTLDISANNDAVNGQDPRGANSPEEFERQRAKILNAIKTIDADVLGLIELENNATASLQNLVDGLNALYGAPTYDFIETGIIGTDAIKLGIIYKPASVTPYKDFAILTSEVDPDFIDDKNRPSLAQSFTDSRGNVFTLVVNHLKSKGSNCNDINDPDTGDGQGNCNQTRVKAVQALLNWLETDPTDSGNTDYLLVGDFNSYAQEDPIDVLREAGYVDLAQQFARQDEFVYSYQFGGQFGTLDYAFASPTLLATVKGAVEWHINSDEPVVLDYNLEFKNDRQDEIYYNQGPFRSSDHDPVIVGLTLQNPVVSFATTSATIDEKDEPYTVTINLSKPKIQDETIIVSIATNARYGLNGKGDYITNPDGSTGTITIPVPAGATTASFTVIPDKNAAKKKSPQVITFTINDTSSGLDIDAASKTFILTITDDKYSNSKEGVLSVSPNPTSGNVTIAAQADSDVLEATLRSPNGEIIFSGKGNAAELSRQISNALQNRRGGVYNLQTIVAGEVVNTRVVKF